MPRRPRIGITTAGRNAEGYVRINAKYADAVRRAGAIPVLLPPGDATPEELFAFLDGFVMTGGGDIDPELYGGRAHAEIYGVDRERDATEIELARAIVAARKPALCICRGMQVLGVALGAKIVEHVPDEFGERVLHRAQGDYQMHAVDIEPDSELARVLGVTQPMTASWHHQSVRPMSPEERGAASKLAAADVRIVARSIDGVVEAIETNRHPELVAVQWHPEHTAQTDPLQQRLFANLVMRAQRDLHERTSSMRSRTL